METMDYKKLTENFVYGLNYKLQDPLFCPDYKGGKYELVYEETEDEMVFLFQFTEGDDKITFSRTARLKSYERFYESVYSSVLSIILFGSDSINENTNSSMDMFDPETNQELILLSFDTLSRSGLDVYRKHRGNG